MSRLLVHINLVVLSETTNAMGGDEATTQAPRSPMFHVYRGLLPSVTRNGPRDDPKRGPRSTSPRSPNSVEVGMPPRKSH